MNKKNTLRTTTALLSVMTFLAFSVVVSAQVRKFDGQAFASPDEAAKALIAAASTYDETALTAILGKDSTDIIHTGEPARDKQTSMDFGAMGTAKQRITYAPKNKMLANLLVGEEDWPFPIPLVKQGTKWYFDTKAGRQEILYRRVGRNELDAIEACRGYVEAQHEYASTKHDGALVNQYAQKLISSPGKQDGLAWQNADGTWGGTVGERAAKDIAMSYTGQRMPFHGYYFKVLKSQGAAAPLGALNYIHNGAMIGGFALLAYPATYRVTGVKSFLVSHDGVVYEKDLGAETSAVAGAINEFNPDLTWSPVDEE